MPRHRFNENAQFVRTTELSDAAADFAHPVEPRQLMLPLDAKRYEVALRLKSLGIDPDDFIDFIDDRQAQRGTR